MGPWSRKWQPTPISLPGKPHGQRSLAGYSSWGRKELDTTEHVSTHMLEDITYPFVSPRFFICITVKAMPLIRDC